jgi:hypothetical protein
MLTLADGTFFPLVVGAIPWGRASGPMGLAREALQECGCSCKVFPQSLPVCVVLVSADIGRCYRVIQVDAHAPFDKVSSWSGDSSMKVLMWVC